MNGEITTSRRHSARGTHDVDEAETSCKQYSVSHGLCHGHDCLRTNPTGSVAASVLDKSKYGRRRTESAPDALLDCLHCGKDLLDRRDERAGDGCMRRHSRRYTVASERVCTPKISTSTPRISFARHQRGDDSKRCEVCETSCLEGTRSTDGRCADSRKERFNRDGCGQCCGDSSTWRDFSENNVGKFGRKKSREKECVSGRDEPPRVNSTDRYPRMFTFDDSSGDDYVRPCASSHQNNSKSVACGQKYQSTCKWDSIDDSTCDYDDSEFELFNVNENRRRKSVTSLTRSLHNDGNRMTKRTKSKRRHSYPGQRSERHSCPELVTKHAERQNEDLKKGHKGRCGLTPDHDHKNRHQQALTSADEEDNGEGRETVETQGPGGAGPRSDSLLVTHLSDMLRRHHLCDVTLRSSRQGEGVRAHKLALAAFSNSFARKYCEGDSRGGEVLIDIPDTSVGGIQEVLRFIYSGGIRLCLDNVGNVLAAASFLHIDHIVNMCRQIILNPDIENVVFFSSLAEKHHLCEDLTCFYDFMCKHFLRVSRTRGWKTLTFAQVFDLLSENNLNVDRELDVFHAAVAWIDGDRPSRLTFAADLIGCVRFAYITPDEIAKHVESKQFLFQGDEGKELLLCIYRHHALHTCGCQHGQRGHHLPRRHYVAQETLPVRDHCNSANSPQRTLARPPTSTARTVSRPPLLTCDVILAVGGVNPFRPDVEDQARLAAQFHPRHNRWTTLTRLPDGRHHHGAVLLEGCLYIIGGSILDDMNPEHLCNPSASCYRYDLTTKQWTAIAPLNVPRMYHATAVLNDVIFVIAGQTQQSRHLSSMECYRPEVGEWEAGVEMYEGRIGVAVAAFRGLLYAVGGFLEKGQEHVVRDTVETFDPRTCSWTCLNGLPSPRCHAGLVECGGRLYLVGGSTFPAHTCSVCSLPSLLRYDDKDDRWDRIQTLRNPRHDMGVAVLGSRIFVVGGVSSVENKVLNDVECFDVETNYWLDDVEPIGSPALGLACVTLLADQ